MLLYVVTWCIQREMNVTPRFSAQVEDPFLELEDSVVCERNTRLGRLDQMTSFMQRAVRSAVRRMTVGVHRRDLELDRMQRQVTHSHLTNQTNGWWVKSSNLDVGIPGIAQLNISFA